MFKDILLDVTVAPGYNGTPGMFNTEIVESDSKDESRNGTVEQGLGDWDIGYLARFPDVFARVLRVHFIVHGRLHTFRFRDFLDYEVAASEGVFTTLTSTTRQLCKRWADGSEYYDQPTILPLRGSLTIVGSGVYTVNYSTGVLTIVSGAAPTSWHGKKHKLCRFDIDGLRPAIPDPNGAIVCPGIPIKEVPLSSA